MLNLNIDAYNGSIDVDLYLKGEKTRINYAINFLFDTGATLSSIRKSSLLGLGYNFAWIAENSVHAGGNIITATGERVSKHYIQLPQVTVLGRDFMNWPFIIHPSRNEDFNNLLGVDIQHFFDASILRSEDCKFNCPR